MVNYDWLKKNILKKIGIFQKNLNFTTMNYYHQINEIRLNLHRDLVQEATVRNTVNGNESDGVLLLNKTVDVGDFTVGGICCETGFILSTDCEKIIPYQKLSIEQLSVLHDYVVIGKQYSFTLNSQLV